MASELWAGESFRNVAPIQPGLRDPTARMPSLGDFLCGGTRRMPSAPLPMQDPRASPSQLAGPKRFEPAAVALKDLPVIDAVLVSHDHDDALCHPTIKALAKPAVPFITSLGVGAHLQAWGVATERITELDGWQSHRLPGSEVEGTAAPTQHFSGRGLKDRNATLWSSLAIRGAPSARPCTRLGRTGRADELAEVVGLAHRGARGAAARRHGGRVVETDDDDSSPSRHRHRRPTWWWSNPARAISGSVATRAGWVADTPGSVLSRRPSRPSRPSRQQLQRQPQAGAAWRSWQRRQAATVQLRHTLCNR